MSSEKASIKGEGPGNIHQRMAAVRAASPAQSVADESGKDIWLLTRYNDVKAAFTDSRLRRDVIAHQTVTAALEGKPVDPAAVRAEFEKDPRYQVLLRNMLHRDPPDHTRLRRLINKTFTPRATERLRPRIEQLVDRMLDAMAAGGSQHDLVKAFAKPIPVIVITELLGVPDGERPDFLSWATTVIDAPLESNAYWTALAEGRDFLLDLIEHKRLAPGADLLSDLITVSDTDTERLPVEDLMAMAMLLLLAGSDTTVNLICNTVVSLIAAPEQFAAVRADMDLLPSAIEETLRFECPVHLSFPRIVTEPITYGNETVPVGGYVVATALAANRDPEHFQDPDRFDITRQPNDHLAFGHGYHYCPGAPLARLEARIAIGRLITRFPKLRLTIAPDQVEWRDSTLMHGPLRLPVLID